MQHNVPVLIVHPSALFREGLRRILYEAQFHPVWCDERAPVGRIWTVSELVSPLLIVGLDVEEALVCIADVKRCYPTARVVLLAEQLSRPQLVTALRGGVATVLENDSSFDAVINTLKLVATGSAVLPAALLGQLLESGAPAMPAYDLAPLPPQLAPAEPVALAPPRDSGRTDAGIAPEFAHLSTREFDVLECLLDGLSNKQIAAQLDIAEATVKVHVKAILRKARLRNRVQVAMWASRGGMQSSEVLQNA